MRGGAIEEGVRRFGTRRNEAPLRRLAVCFKFPASAFPATSAGDSERRSLLARGWRSAGLLWSAHNGRRVRYLTLNAGTLADNLRCTSG